MQIVVDIDDVTGAVTITTIPSTSSGDDNTGDGESGPSIEERLANVERVLTEVTGGLTAIALPEFRLLQDRAEFVQFHYEFVSVEGQPVFRVNEEAPTSVTDPTPLGPIPIIFQDAEYSVHTDSGVPETVKVWPGYNFLDVETPVPGVTYTVNAIGRVVSQSALPPDSDPA